MARRVNMRELSSTGGVSVNTDQEGFAFSFQCEVALCICDPISTQSDYSRNDGANASDV